MKKIFFVIILFTSVNSHAQFSSSKSFGVELDLLPYLNNGYYVSLWIMQDQFRMRGIISALDIPDAARANGFKSHNVKAFAWIVDYFFENDLRGVWVAGGLEAWSNKLTSDQEVEGDAFESYMFTTGVGYVWPIFKHFYVNPWVAAHIHILGDDKVEIGTRTFNVPIITPSASIKFGVYF